MKHLLINGCSYGHTWKNYDQLADKLGAELTTNISCNGSSNERIFRTTFEYVLANPTVDFVIIMLTFYNRFEAPWAVKKGAVEGSWISYSHNGILSDHELTTEYQQAEHKLRKYIETRAVYDTDMIYIEKLIIGLIMLTSWLDSRSIKYCVVNMGENLIKHAVDTNRFDTRKISLLRENKRIIDIENFLANEWMYNQGAVIRESEIAMFAAMGATADPKWVHYDLDGYTMLNNFLYNYINENCL